MKIKLAVGLMTGCIAIGLFASTTLSAKPSAKKLAKLKELYFNTCVFTAMEIIQEADNNSDTYRSATIATSECEQIQAQADPSRWPSVSVAQESGCSDAVRGHLKDKNDERTFKGVHNILCKHDEKIEKILEEQFSR